MKSYLLGGFLIFAALLCIPAVSAATPEYARQTGFACGKCHIDAGGGGPLTKTGELFLARLKKEGRYRPAGAVRNILQLLVGYIHLLTAIAWFGAILYVHILLKPSYASRGLPRGELLLGWVSIMVIAVTGTILTVERMPSLKSFFTTRFGILLGIKILLFLLMVMSAAIVTFFIGPRMRARMKRQDAGRAAAEKEDLGIAELNAFDGKEGRQSYVAYEGNVYDVTGSRLWKDGSHMRKHAAGNDLTEMLKTAPHGEDKVLAMKRVGRLRSESGKQRPFHERLFYFFAYMNLVMVFLIVFVIALMRWWQ